MRSARRARRYIRGHTIYHRDKYASTHTGKNIYSGYSTMRLRGERYRVVLNDFTTAGKARYAAKQLRQDYGGKRVVLEKHGSVYKIYIKDKN